MPFPVSDDNGDGQSGTILDEAFFTLIGDDIAAVQADSDAVLAEVTDARGTQLSLDDRLDVSINEDGTLKQAAVQGLIGISNGLNLVGNDTFLSWPNGDTEAPADWSLSGAGATVQRTGNGLADTSFKWGRYAVRIAGNLVPAVLSQVLVSSADMGFAQAMVGRRIAFGARVKSSAAGFAQVGFFDGVTETLTAFHSGSAVSGPELDGWEWLSAVHTVAAGPTELTIRLRTGPSALLTNGHFSGVTVLFDEIVPVDWLPALVTRKVYHHHSMGAQSTGVKAYFNSERIGVIRAVQAHLQTAPVGSTFVIDVQTVDGAGTGTFASIFAGAGTRCIIADGARNGGALPDGTFARRCLQTQFSATEVDSGIVRIEITQVGSGTAGSDLTVDIYYESWNRPLDELRLS